MPFPISDWFTAGHMTYHNSTIQLRKSNITGHSQRSVYSYVIKAANIVNDHGPTGLPYKVT